MSRPLLKEQEYSTVSAAWIKVESKTVKKSEISKVKETMLPYVIGPEDDEEDWDEEYDDEEDW